MIFAKWTASVQYPCSTSTGEMKYFTVPIKIHYCIFWTIRCTWLWMTHPGLHWPYTRLIFVYKCTISTPHVHIVHVYVWLRGNAQIVEKWSAHWYAVKSKENNFIFIYILYIHVKNCAPLDNTTRASSNVSGTTCPLSGWLVMCIYVYMWWQVPRDHWINGRPWGSKQEW